MGSPSKSGPLPGIVSQPHLPSNPKGDDWRFFIRQFEAYCNYYKLDSAQWPFLLEMSLGRGGLDILDGRLKASGSYHDIDAALNSLGSIPQFYFVEEIFCTQPKALQNQLRSSLVSQ